MTEVRRKKEKKEVEGTNFSHFTQWKLEDIIRNRSLRILFKITVN